MKNIQTEEIDRELAHDIKKYLQMEEDDALESMADEWPEQIAILLGEFLFKTHCPHCQGTPDYIDLERDRGDSFYIAPLCECETSLYDEDIYSGTHNEE